MPPAGEKNDGSAMPVMLGPGFRTHFALDPCKISAAGFVPKNLLLVVNQFGNDAATRNVVFIDDNESAGGLECV